MYNSFQQSYITGRRWLLDQYLEVLDSKDNLNVELFLTKKDPALKASEKLAEVQRERRDLLKKYKVLEYQLKTYEEYFA